VFVLTLILIGVIVMTLIFGKNNPFTRGVKVLFTPVLTLAANATEKIAVVKTYFVELDAYKQENEKLIAENTQLRQKEKSAAQFRKENERLSELLELKNDIKKYDTVAAKVVSYEPNNWYDTIVINKGTSSGIEKDDIVVAPEGVVGKISDVGTNWANISSILSIDNAIGTIVPRTGEIAVTEGDKELSEQKLCKLTFVNAGAQIAVGDLLETSGTVGLYPEGLSIGTVKETTIDANGTKYAIVEPGVEFEQLYEVLVIKRSE